MCVYCLIDNPWVQGIVGGIIVSVVWLGGVLLYKILRYDSLYSKYEGKYNQYLKRDEQKEIWAVISLTRKGNKFIVDGKILKGESLNDRIVGEISMDDRMPLYGRGYYKHEGKPLFGFYEIQINSQKEDFYIHVNYNTNNESINQG